MLAKKGDASCVKMIDFGLSKDFSETGSMKTMSGSVSQNTSELLTKFQPYYIAPEVFLQNYNQKIDIWSMGVVLYIMLSGKVPFPGNSELEIIGNVIKGEFHFKHEPFAQHSKEAKDFLQCLIVKDVAQRFTAEQAFNHPWIQNNSTLSDKPMAEQAFKDIVETLDNAKRLKRAVLTYLSQRFTASNLSELKKAFTAADPTLTLFLTSAEFQMVMQKCGAYVGDHVFKELCAELDPKQTGQIPY